MQIPTNYLKGLAISVLFSFHSMAYPQQSDWTWQNPLPQGNDLFQVNMIDINLTYAIGNGGTVMKSADGGVTWAILNTGTTSNLRQADFLENGLIGYASGVDSTILKTSDGGINWQTVSVNPSFCNRLY
jgi:photosystem II stability/assembly factor-like uncharacterized protein